MKNQTVILLIVAGACGLVAMLGVKQYMAKQNQKEEVPKAKALVATAPIKQGVPLTDQIVAVKEVNVEDCPEGVVTSLDQIKQRALKTPRGPGDWILLSHLTEEGDTGIAPNIPPGMRVMTIPVDATTTHSGMLQPGNRIDLFGTFREKDPVSGQQKEKTVLVLEYIEVFAVDSQVFGRDTSTDNAKARNISLLVDVEQAMKLTVANRKGTISTVLRSNEDMDKTKIAEVTEDILSGASSGQLERRSALDVQHNLNDSPNFLVADQPPTTIVEQLRSELDNSGPFASGPVPNPEENTEDGDEDFWTMAIHESGAVRVVKVNTKSDEPIDTTGSRAGRLPGASAVPGSAPTGGFALPPEFDPDLPGTEQNGLDEDDLEELEESVTGALDSLF